MLQRSKSFSDYAALQHGVSQAIGAIADCFERVEANERAGQLRRSQLALESDTFKVLVVGEFKRGKSTAINAMLGARILPAKVAPCTAVITRVKFGVRKQAALHHRDGKSTTELDLELDPAALTKHLVIEHTGGDEENEQSRSPYSAAEVLYPLELLKNNVELVDSPGLNEHAIQEALLHLLPQREQLLRVPLETLRQTLETERPRLEEAERQCERAMRAVDRRADSMVREAQASLRSFMAELDAGLQRHAKTVEISTWDAIRSKSEVGKKLATALEEWMSAQTRQWERQQLQPLLETHWRDLIEDIDDQAGEFLENLEQIRAAFSTAPNSVDVAEQDVTAISRLLGAGLGLLSVGSMMEGAALGVGPAVKGLAINLAERERSQMKTEDQLAQLTEIRGILGDQLKIVQGVLMEIG